MIGLKHYTQPKTCYFTYLATSPQRSSTHPSSLRRATTKRVFGHCPPGFPFNTPEVFHHLQSITLSHMLVLKYQKPQRHNPHLQNGVFSLDVFIAFCRLSALQTPNPKPLFALTGCRHWRQTERMLFALPAGQTSDADSTALARLNTS